MEESRIIQSLFDPFDRLIPIPYKLIARRRPEFTPFIGQRYSTVSAEMLESFLLGNHSNNDFWSQRTAFFVKVLVMLLESMRETGVAISLKLIRSLFSLHRIVEIYNDESFTDEARELIRSYLICLPGYDPAHPDQVEHRTYVLHEFITMRLCHTVFSSLEEDSKSFLTIERFQNIDWTPSLVAETIAYNNRNKYLDMAELCDKLIAAGLPTKWIVSRMDNKNKRDLFSCQLGI